MGNLCFGKKKPKKPKTPAKEPKKGRTSLSKENTKPEPAKPKPEKQVDGTDSPVPEKITSNIERVTHEKQPDKGAQIQAESPNNLKISEKETNIAKHDYSFAKVTRTGENKFSFEVYGEDISALNPKFLMDNLGHISHTSKINISRNDLLLLTEENQEILKFLSANNITRKDLIEGMRKEHAPGSIALDDKMRITGNMIQSRLVGKLQIGGPGLTGR